MGLFSNKIADQAKKPPRRSLTSLLFGEGLLVLDPKHPEGGYRDDGTHFDADFYWNNPDLLRRKLERGEL